MHSSHAVIGSSHCVQDALDHLHEGNHLPPRPVDLLSVWLPDAPLVGVAPDDRRCPFAVLVDLNILLVFVNDSSLENQVLGNKNCTFLRICDLSLTIRRQFRRWDTRNISRSNIRAWHFRYFLIFSVVKIDFIAFFIKLITYFCTSPIEKAHSQSN